jgi:hypothetical protein
MRRKYSVGDIVRSGRHQRHFFGAGDNVTICAGTTVTQNVAGPTINTLTIMAR